MSYLNNHVNVHSTCLALLDLKGWSLEIFPGPYEANNTALDTYIARRDGTEIVAGNPLELLGLAAIHEHHHPHGDESYWWVVGENRNELKERLEDEALERAFFQYKDRDFDAWKGSMKEAMAERSNRDDNPPLHEWLGISEDSMRSLSAEYPDLFHL